MIQGYPQSLLRRPYGINTDKFLVLMTLRNCELVSFFAKSLNKPPKDEIQDRRLQF